jgi:hypothetical protein
MADRSCRNLENSRQEWRTCRFGRFQQKLEIAVLVLRRVPASHNQSLVTRRQGDTPYPLFARDLSTYDSGIELQIVNHSRSFAGLMRGPCLGVLDGTCG